MRMRLLFLLLIATSLLSATTVYAQLSPLQSNATMSNVPLLFHAYREIIDNSSSYFYDGADGCASQRTSAFITTVECHTYGTIDYPPFGTFDYWLGQVSWNLTRPLSHDLHVQGTVNMSVWANSTFPLSGFFVGSGYGGALVDLDEQGNVINIFEFPFAQEQGGNIFSPTPAESQLTLDLDYVFEKDHTILFSFGFGSNVEGFVADVHFDAPDRDSGITLPVRDLAISFCDGEPDISLDPTSWNENLSPNEVKARTFVIENVGNGALYISEISESVDWLSITSDPTPLWLQPGNSTTCQVEMQSTDLTEIQNTIITISSNDLDEPRYEIPVTMKVGIIDDPPTVSITVPDLAIIDEPITVQVDASDDEGVETISAYFDGSWHVHNCTGVRSCSFNWTITESYPGQYTYKAKATDTVGQWSSIVEDTVSVQSTSLTRDLGIADYNIPASVALGETVTFLATIENQGDPEETSRITFSVNDSTICTESVTLSPGESTTKTCQWTAPDEISTATIKVTIDPITNEIDRGDNEVVVTINIVEPLPWLTIVAGIIALSSIGIILWKITQKK